MVFDGQNWQLWLQSMWAFLMSNGLWAFINGDQQEPSHPLLLQDHLQWWPLQHLKLRRMLVLWL